MNLIKENKVGKPVQNCRMCNNNILQKVLDLGFSPPSDSFLTEQQLKEPEIFFPLELYSCTKCGLVQLGYVVSPKILYRNNYPYEASLTETGKKHFFEMAETICRKLDLKPGSIVVDIGSNVGVLLSGFMARGMKVIGIDPATNIAKIANNNGIYTIPDFFSQKIAKKILLQKGKANIITGTNVFAHVNDLNKFMKAIKVLLKKDGVFIIEAPYLAELINGLEYDTIYHEHLSYISIKPLVKFLEKFNMTIFDIETQNIHGGSIRIYIGNKNVFVQSKKVIKHIKLEKKIGIYSYVRLKKFAEEVKTHRKLITALLFDLKKNNKRIVGISAPAKGNTLLNYCKIDSEVLDFITEKSKIKIGLYTPGTHIKICPDSSLLKEKPDYALILAWNFADEIIKNLKSFRKNGGKFIIPIPKPKIV